MTREEAVKMLNSFLELSYFEITKRALTMAIDALEQPEIVFCNECKHSLMIDNRLMMCTINANAVMPHGFCSRARRREECQQKDDNSHPFTDDVMMEVEQ